MYKMIVSDLDGTLFNEEHKLSEYTKKVIKKLGKKEILFFLATGRHYSDVIKLKDELGLPPSYSVSCNGARVHGINGELLIKHNIEDKIANEILCMEDFNNLEGGACTDEKIYLLNLKNFNKHAETARLPLEIYKGNKSPVKDIIKIFYLSDNTEILNQTAKMIQNKWANYVDVVFSHEKCLEIIPKNISKGYAIREIAKVENIELKDILAFGDGFNDMEMLSIVGKGLIMGNASENLKKSLPNNEIIGINKEDSVAKYLEKLYLSY